MYYKREDGLNYKLRKTWIQIAGYSYKHETAGLEHIYVIHPGMSRKLSILKRAVSIYLRL
jgi:hypothetical protein